MFGLSDEEYETEKDNMEFEKYEASGSKDDFKTWKLKKYIDQRIVSYLVPVITGLIVLSYFIKNGI